VTKVSIALAPHTTRIANVGHMIFDYQQTLGFRISILLKEASNQKE